jgi:ribosomal protein S21
MSNAVRVRVEARWPQHASDGDKKRIGYALIKAFKKVYDEAGIEHDYKEHRFYIKPSEKRRRKKRQKHDVSYNKWAAENPYGETTR